MDYSSVIQKLKNLNIEENIVKNNDTIERDIENDLIATINSNRKSIILTGNTGSGKTTLIKRVLSNVTDYIYIDQPSVDNVISEIEKRFPRNYYFKAYYNAQQPRVVVCDNYAFSWKIARKLVQKYPMILFVFVVSTSDSKRKSDFSVFSLSFSIKEISEYLSNWGLSKLQITAALKSGIYFKNFVHLQGYAKKERFNKLSVNIRTYHGYYLSASFDGKITANKQTPSTSELFEISNVDNYITIKSAHGKYLSVEPSGNTIIDRPSPREWERFTLHEIGSFTYALKTHHGKFICVEKNTNKVIANRDAPESWERLEFIV